MSEEEIKKLGGVDFLDQAKLIDKRLKKLKGKSLSEKIVERLKSDRHSLAHALLSSLPVNEIMTTNYDTMFEEACAYQQIKVLPYQEQNIQSPFENFPNKWLLKMHGCINHPEDIVLTREHYLRYKNKNSALQGVMQSLIITRKLLFLGFSLTDTNFHKAVDSY